MNLLVCVGLALALFVIGLAIILLRKELLFILMGIEVMFNSAAFIAIIGTQYWHDPFGQVLTLLIMIIAGVELAVALLIVLHCYRSLKLTRIEEFSQLHD